MGLTTSSDLVHLSERALPARPCQVKKAAGVTGIRAASAPNQPAPSNFINLCTAVAQEKPSLHDFAVVSLEFKFLNGRWHESNRQEGASVSPATDECFDPLAARCRLPNFFLVVPFPYLSRNFSPLRSRTSEFGNRAIGIVRDLMAGQSARVRATVVGKRESLVLSYDIDIEIY